MAKRNMAQKRQQKALKRKKKKQAQHIHEKFSVRYADSADYGLPKLSETLLDFAQPILGDSSDKGFIEGAMGMVIMCWNIGTVNFHEAQKMRDELDKTFIENLGSSDFDATREFGQELDLLITARRMFYADDPRLVIKYDLSWNMIGDYNLQVQSILMPEEGRFDPDDKEHLSFGLSAGTQQSITELQVPATEEQDPVAELIKQGNQLLMEEGVDYAYATNAAEACNIWLEAWEKVKALYQDTDSIGSIKPFAGIRLSNWCGYLEMYLCDAGREDPAYFEKRIQYCREFCREFPASDDQIIHNMIRGEAETLFFSGQYEQGETVFRQLIERFPDNAWGYIGWGDMYSGDYIDLPENLAKAESLYQIPIDRQLNDDDVARDRLDDLLALQEEEVNVDGRILEHETEA